MPKPNNQTAFTRVSSKNSIGGSSHISANTGPIPSMGRGIPGNPQFNFNINVKTNPVKVKKTEDTTKRMPAKKGYGGNDKHHKFKNDGQNDDGEGEEDDEDEDEEDPDLALFNEANRKNSNMSPNQMKKSPSLAKSSSNGPQAAPSGPMFDFPTFTSAVATPGAASISSSAKNEEVKGGANGTKLPPASAIQFDLNATNLKKHNEGRKEGLKRRDRSGSVGENLSEVTLSEQDFETTDKIFGQYVKVNRTKQKYRCEFADVVLHIAGSDYIIKKLHAEINGQ